MTNYIPFAPPDLGPREEAAVIEALRSGWITSGPKVSEFEAAFLRRVEGQYSVAVNSCTAAMHIALAAAGIGPGDEVITTPYTFIASVEVICYLGATPVLVDIDPVTWNIDPAAIAAAITPRAKAIIPVHMAGLSCDMEAIHALARKHGLFVLEDCAHAVPARYRDGRPIGSGPGTAAFSFYANKNLACGEGGMLVTPDPAIADKARVLRLHGMSRDAWKRYAAGGKWRYEIQAQGYKYNMPELQAALGLVQLDRLDEMQSRRISLVRRYQANLGRTPEAWTLPPDGPGHPWHLFILRLRNENWRIDRDRIADLITEAGIGINVHFIPVPHHPYYRDTYGFRAEDYPRAEAAYRSALTLPLSSVHKPEQIDRVCEVLEGLWREWKAC